MMVAQENFEFSRLNFIFSMYSINGKFKIIPEIEFFPVFHEFFLMVKYRNNSIFMEKTML